MGGYWLDRGVSGEYTFVTGGLVLIGVLSQL